MGKIYSSLVDTMSRLYHKTKRIFSKKQEKIEEKQVSTKMFLTLPQLELIVDESVIVPEVERKIIHTSEKLEYGEYTRKFAEIPIAAQVCLFEFFKCFGAQNTMAIAEKIAEKASHKNGSLGVDLMAHAEYLGYLALKNGAKITE